MTGMKLTMSMCFLAATVAIVSANYPPPSSPPTEDLGGGGAPPTVFVSTTVSPSFPTPLCIVRNFPCWFVWAPCNCALTIFESDGRFHFVDLQMGPIQIPGYINVWIKMGLQKLTKLSPCMAPDKGLRYAQDLVALFR